MKTVKDRRLSFDDVAETVRFWPEFRRTVSSYHIIDFQYKVVDAGNYDTSWGFWARAQKFRDGWRFQAEVGSIDYWSRQAEEFPTQHSPAIRVLLSDFTVKLQALTGPLKVLEARLT